jgi:hypothetical protein
LSNLAPRPALIDAPRHFRAPAKHCLALIPVGAPGQKRRDRTRQLQDLAVVPALTSLRERGEELVAAILIPVQCRAFALDVQRHGA